MSKTFGIISLIAGIIGLFIFGYILGAIAIISGIIGIISTEKDKSNGLSVAGLVLGIIDVALLFILQNALAALF